MDQHPNSSPNGDGITWILLIVVIALLLLFVFGLPSLVVHGGPI
jgi:flagellar basal body-associated protein FliL